MCLYWQKRREKQTSRLIIDHSPCPRIHCTISFRAQTFYYYNLYGNASYREIHRLLRQCQCHTGGDDDDRWEAHKKTSSRLKCSLRRKWKIRIRFLCIYFKSDIISQKLIGICGDTLPTNVTMTAENRWNFFGLLLLLLLISSIPISNSLCGCGFADNYLNCYLLYSSLSLCTIQTPTPPPPSIWYVFVVLYCPCTLSRGRSGV